jgi:hypothetical protein
MSYQKAFFGRNPLRARGAWDSGSTIVPTERGHGEGGREREKRTGAREGLERGRAVEE